MELVHIEWKDCTSESNDWIDIKDVQGVLQTVDSVGWILTEDKEKIIILPTISKQEKQCFGAITIPKSWINKISNITLKPRKEKC